MRKIGLLILVILASINVNGQVKIIELKNEGISIPQRNFYISSVIDGRADKSKIGFAQVGAFNKKVDANFKLTLEETLQQYFNSVLPKADNQEAVVLKIIDLYISEKTLFTSETGRAEIKIEFYKINNNGQLGKVYEAEAFFEEPAMDVTKKHETRIRKVISDCLKRFSTSNWQEIHPDFKPNELIIATTEQIDSTIIEARKSIKIRSIVTFSKTLGINASGWGLNYHGYVNKDEQNKWLIPYTISIENATINTDLFNGTDYQSFELGYFVFGLTGLKKINDILYFQLQGRIPVGNERLTDFSQNEKSNFIIGFGASQGIMLIPKSKFGIVLSAGFYETLLTSELYKNDIGFKFELGLKF